MYVVPCAVKSAWVLRTPEKFLIILIILLTSPFIAFFSDRANILADLEDAVGGPIRDSKRIQEQQQEQQPQQGWLREKPSLMRAWIAPIE